MDVEFRVDCEPSTRAELSALFDRQKTLEDVVRWGLSHRPPLLVDNVVVQDEYTHDVVITHPLGAVLVYDTTWLGGLTAVAVWSEVPDADALLLARLARGWEPTPTAMKDGARILGHAACVVKGA